MISKIVKLLLLSAIICLVTLPIATASITLHENKITNETCSGDSADDVHSISPLMGDPVDGGGMP